MNRPNDTYHVVLCLDHKPLLAGVRHALHHVNLPPYEGDTLALLLAGTEAEKFNETSDAITQLSQISAASQEGIPIGISLLGGKREAIKFVLDQGERGIGIDLVIANRTPHHSSPVYIGEQQPIDGFQMADELRAKGYRQRIVLLSKVLNSYDPKPHGVLGRFPLGRDHSHISHTTRAREAGVDELVLYQGIDHLLGYLAREYMVHQYGRILVAQATPPLARR